MVFLSLHEGIDYILKSRIYDCDGIKKECNRCICNVGIGENGQITCSNEVSKKS